MSSFVFYILSLLLCRLATTRRTLGWTKRIICVCLFIICVHSIWTIPEPESDSISRFCTLDEVTIVAKKQTVVIPAQSLDGERLQELSAHSVADAMRYFSGVQIKDFGGVGGIKTVDIRSMGSHHVGVFYDGIEVGNAQNGTVDLSKV